MTVTTGAPAGPGPLSPRVRRLARDHGVDLAQVRATGPGGRLTAADVTAWLERHRPGSAPASRPAPPPGRLGATGTPASSKRSADTRATTPSTLQTAPATGAAWPLAFAEVDLHAVERAAGISTGATGVGINTDAAGVGTGAIGGSTDAAGCDAEVPYHLPYICAAVAAELRDHPLLNASHRGETAAPHDGVDLAVELRRGGGRAVTVLRSADRLPLSAIAAALAAPQPSSAPAPATTEPAGFTLTAVTAPRQAPVLTVPALAPSHTAVLALGPAVRRVVAVPAAEGEALAVHSVANLLLSWQSAAVDADYAAGFLAQVIAALTGTQRGNEPYVPHARH
jgi:pyruvate/2-oxoglutarate dehydrogenase complex dihydrolipoamide acyltransferase (E2) component